MNENAAATPNLVAKDELLPPLPPRVSTVDQAASVLRVQIAAGRLPPGTRLREEHVADSLSISRNTVREVFRLLAHERLVDHIAHRGVHVRRMGVDDIRALYRTRRLVEPLGLRAAITDAQVRSVMRTAVDRAAAAAAANDWYAVGTEDIAFHRALMDGCRSVHLATMTEQLLAELRLAFLQLPDPEVLHRPFLARNHRILELIHDGDEAVVIADLDDYLTCSEALVLQSIDS